MPESSYTCPICHRVSHNPTDVAERYCGACHTFERDAVPVVGYVTGDGTIEPATGAPEFVRPPPVGRSGG